MRKWVLAVFEENKSWCLNEWKIANVKDKDDTFGVVSSSGFWNLIENWHSGVLSVVGSVVVKNFDREEND